MSKALAGGAAALVLVAVMGFVAAPEPVSAQENYVPITGAGSTWSAVAVDQWRSDVRRNGIVVNYNPNGSTAGRQDFIQKLTDFGVSEIPFQTVVDTEQGNPEFPTRSYSYLPIVAGGTSFMYHVNVGGRRITDLRLSGPTIARIFTGVITNWNDPAITADNNRRVLPSKPITPVVRADGSGTSAQFSLWMSKRQAGIWNPFCQRYLLRPPPCGLTSFYPAFPGAKAQRGSDGVSNYVASSFGDGSITYVEYSYALLKNFPVAKVLNSKGYFTLPTASNVAVALTRAQINPNPGPNYLTQILDGVYDNDDSRAYPLSSYSYFIVPRDTPDPPFNLDKGKTLSTFINYFLCYGQQKAESLGYSPLPKNLVLAGFDQVDHIPGHVPTPDRSNAGLEACNNPTFRGGRNVLLDTAPFPPECDHIGQNLCGGGGPGGGGPGGGGPGGPSAGPGAGPGAGPSSGPIIDPETGAIIDPGGGTDPVGNEAFANVVTVGNRGMTNTGWYGVLLAAEILLLIAAPPTVAAGIRALRNRRRKP